MILDESGRPMVPVHVCWSDPEAAVVVSYLGAHGIEAQANSEVPHNILPVRVGILGRIRVLVREDDEAEARALLAEIHEREVEADVEPTGEPDEPVAP